jgi:purine nucleosidase
VTRPATEASPAPSRPTRIHLDTDFAGDIDDACALALLLATPGVELTGVTTVLEDGGRRAGYVREFVELAAATIAATEIPVAAGADQAHGYFRESAYPLPLEDRYWPRPVPPAPGPVNAALDLLAASIEAGATIVAIGPLTNLALLEARAPGTLARATICVMGGRVAPPPEGFPDWGVEGDFNLQADAPGALAVLRAADPSRLTFVPIEVTVQTALRRTDLDALRPGGPIARLIARQADAFGRDERLARQYAAYPAIPEGFINFQHDPLAVAATLGSPSVTVEDTPLALALEDSWLHLRPDPRGDVFRLITAVDARTFEDRWLEAVRTV